MSVILVVGFNIIIVLLDIKSQKSQRKLQLVQAKIPLELMQLLNQIKKIN